MQPLPNFEDCGLFRKTVDPHTDIVSYLLDRRVALHQQGWYFTQKSMTDDGRFLVFWSAPSELSEPRPTERTRRLRMVDFLRDAVVEIDDGLKPYCFYRVESGFCPAPYFNTVTARNNTMEEDA